MFLNFIDYFKFIFLCCPFLFLTNGVLSQSLCSKEDAEKNPFHLEQISRKFNDEMNTHYNSLSITESRKNEHLEKYKNPLIKIYSNPQNKLQKLVYIEYEKNWWGSLYFALVEDKEISKWIKIETHGAITTCVRWDKERFFYEDSTHMGTKTRNVCIFRKGSIRCKKDESEKEES